MSEVFKTFNTGEKKITSALTHKEWSASAANSSSLGIAKWRADYIPKHDWNPADPDATPYSETLSYGINIDGVASFPIYRAQVHNSIHHLYYRGNDNPYDAFCNDSPHLDVREDSPYYHVIAIPSAIYGEKVKPGSWFYSSSLYTLQDDGYGNLINPNDYTGSVIRNLSSSLFHIGFGDTYRLIRSAGTFTQHDYTSSVLKIESQQNFSGQAYNVDYQFGTSTTVFGMEAKFNGALYTPSSGSRTLDHPTQTSVIQILETSNDEFVMPDEWMIATRIYCPTSQSVSQSYTGAYEGGDSYQARTLGSTHSRNTIATAMEWDGWNNAFELSIYNGTTADNGKIYFRQKSKTEGKTLSLKSSTAINDNAWHDILIVQNTTGTYLYIDGVAENYIGESMYGYNLKSPNLVSIGARRWGYTSKYKNPKTQKWSSVKTDHNWIQPWSGSMDYFRIIPQAVATLNVANCFKDSKSLTDQRGNIFYDHGIAVINFVATADASQAPGDSSTSVSDPFSNANWKMSFRGTHKIKEHLYVCNILDGEFNATYNPTARVQFDARNDNLQPYTTHSEFNPYVTTIGLYDDNNNLCAVGKLASPIKNQDDYDNTFQIRFDTTT